jgi:hypothetical protein
MEAPLAGLDASVGSAGAPSSEVFIAAAPRITPRRSRGSVWFLALVFVPLVSYAILATIAVFILWNRQQQQQAPPSLFEKLPDVDGDAPGVKKSQKTARLIYDEKLATSPLPENLRVALGKTIQIGDLEVTPLRVERKRLRVFVEGSVRPEPCQYDSLVLHLHLRNVSSDLVFTPLDNYFDRCWKDHKGVPPLTQLEVGPKRFFGGSAVWTPAQSKDQRREWVEDRRPGTGELKPGEELETFVCTDGQDAGVLHAVTRYHGSMLWRVQLRRGLVNWRDREVSATAVIGVEFSDRDLEHG